MKEKSPFEILGLNADDLRGKKFDDIAFLVNEMYKVKQRLYHPDNGHNPNHLEIIKINLAYSQIDPRTNVDAFKLYLKEFLRKTPIKARITELESALADLQTNPDANGDNVRDLLLDYLVDFSFNEGPSVFDDNSYEIMMLDTHAYLNNPQFSSHNSRFLNYHMQVAEDGSVSTIKKGEEKLHPSKRLIGTIDSKTLHDYGGLKKILRPFKNFGYENYRFIESPTRKNQYDDKIIYGKTLEIGQFKEFVHLITPKLAKNSTLLSINYREDQAPTISWEGRIMKINRT